MPITSNTHAATAANAALQPAELGEAFAGLQRFCGEPPDSQRKLCEAAAGLLRAVASLVEAAARSVNPGNSGKPEEAPKAPPPAPQP